MKILSEKEQLLARLTELDNLTYYTAQMSVDAHDKCKNISFFASKTKKSAALHEHEKICKIHYGLIEYREMISKQYAALNFKNVMGTVEPIYKEDDSKKVEKIGFIRGMLNKYGVRKMTDTEITQGEIFEYLKKLID